MTRAGRSMRWDEVLFRVLPGPSPVHRVWAGTKLLGIVVVTVGFVAWPGWGATAAAAALAIGAFVAARIPLAVVPLPRWWLVALIVAGGVVAGVGGALDAYIQTFVISYSVVALGAVVGWTTALDDVVGALTVLTGPLARIGVPVSTWSAAAAIGFRSLPMLLDEVRVVFAVRRLRAGATTGRRSIRSLAASVLDVPARLLSATTRRAGEIGLAVAARGGAGAPRRPRPRLGPADAVAGVAVVLSVALAFAVQ